MERQPREKEGRKMKFEDEIKIGKDENYVSDLDYGVPRKNMIKRLQKEERKEFFFDMIHRLSQLVKIILEVIDISYHE